MSVVCRAQPGVHISRPVTVLKLPPLSVDASNAHDTLTSLNVTVKKKGGKCFQCVGENVQRLTSHLRT